MTRLCIVTSTYHRPGETFVNYHIEHLFGGACCVVANDTNGDDPYDIPHFSLSGVPLGSAERMMLPLTRAMGILRHRSITVPTGSTAQALRDFLGLHRPDVILCEFGNRAIQIAPIAGELGIPIFTYFRGFDGSKLLEKPLFPAAYARTFPKLAGVFAVSRFLLDNLANHGLTHPNAHVIPSGADTARFRPAPKLAQKVVAVGRMVEKKTPLITVRAFISAAQQHPEARFTFVGHGKLLEPARALVADAGLTDRIHLPGRLPHEEVAALMADAAIFAQHSVTGKDGNTEGVPSSIQEAMASGCAVVSTRHAGIPEIVEEGNTGLLSDEYDEAHYTQSLVSLLGDPGQTERFGRAGRTFAEAHLDKVDLTKRIETVLQASL
ncbi:Glycosyltransferase involved in cell wall bisynthesis [Poseidonocella pacifica]|uniref:Glycosyltransferase involved in cell wall bisynthesis n=1 Tax=Poseidonocella pacifica TaxID=871651 RepID=A0A1I0VTC3_9RHOB|nr:glycosyltransferase [Poseidonocella pacifica]SFA79542.1 Glycosyltransferase involved in cell wall bisynthesis [Poseidonocella pacifica]